MNNFNKIIILLMVTLVIYYLFFKQRGIGFSFLKHLNINEGFTGDGENITFYKMEGCGHCKTFQPKWEKFQKNNPDANVRVVMPGDGDTEINDNGVKGFPTILLTDSGNKKIKEIPRKKFDEEGGVKKEVTGA